MAEANVLEREYVVPLRREFLKVPRYRRAGRAAKALKQFIAKHMKVSDRDVEKVKIDSYLNNELWFRGKRNPPSRIKVKARKENGIVHVTLVEMPEKIKFAKARHEKRHSILEKKEAPKPEESKEAKAQAKEETAEEKKEETEKEKSVEQEKVKEAKTEQKAAKHITNVKTPEIQRKALNRH